MKRFRHVIRKSLRFFHLDISQNLRYDRMTERIMRRLISRGSNCIDVGCHKGEILEQMLTLAPDGQHYAFEPIPGFYKELVKRFGDEVKVFPYALSSAEGEVNFRHVKNAPAYSGIKERKYDVAKPDVEIIAVKAKRLDDIVPEHHDIAFIKIDVEGGEFDVMKGAQQLLRRCRPAIVFECGLGASEYYKTDPSDLYAFLKGIPGYQLYTLKSFCNGSTPLSEKEFSDHYINNTEYYFIASPGVV